MLSLNQLDFNTRRRSSDDRNTVRGLSNLNKSIVWLISAHCCEPLKNNEKRKKTIFQNTFFYSTTWRLAIELARLALHPNKKARNYSVRVSLFEFSKMF